MEKQAKRLKYVDTEEEYRTRFLGILNVNKSDLYLFVDDEIHSEEKFEEMSLEETSSAIRSASKYERDRFLRFVKERTKYKAVKKRFLDLYHRYFPTVKHDPDFLKALLNRFFTSTWPKNKPIYAISRRDDEEVMMKEGHVRPLSRLKVLGGFEVPVEIARLILSFLPYDYDLICSLGISCSDWYRLILESWFEIEISSINSFEIPLSVWKSVKCLRFQTTQKDIFEDSVLYIRRDFVIPPFSYVFSRIDTTRIRELDFRNLIIKEFEAGKCDTKKRIMFPCCEILRCSMAVFSEVFWNFIKEYFSFGNNSMRVLHCMLVDLLPRCGWDIIKNFERLRSLHLNVVYFGLKSPNFIKEAKEVMENYYSVPCVDIRFLFYRSVTHGFEVNNSVWKQEGNKESDFFKIRDAWWNGRSAFYSVFFEISRFSRLENLSIDVSAGMNDIGSQDFDDAQHVELFKFSEHNRLKNIDWRMDIVWLHGLFGFPRFEKLMEKVNCITSLESFNLALFLPQVYLLESKESIFQKTIRSLDHPGGGDIITIQTLGLKETLGFLDRKGKNLMNGKLFRVTFEFSICFAPIDFEEELNQLSRRRSKRLQNQKKRKGKEDGLEFELKDSETKKKKCVWRVFHVDIPTLKELTKKDKKLVKFRAKEKKLSRKKFKLTQNSLIYLRSIESTLFLDSFYRDCLVNKMFFD